MAITLTRRGAQQAIRVWGRRPARFGNVVGKTAVQISTAILAGRR
jgi:hypothetical protein